VNQLTLYHRKSRLLARYLAPLCVLLICSSPAVAFDELNEVQTLLFNNPHLINTKDGQSITYSYRSEKDEEQPVDDVVTMNITAQIDDERRDVEIEFLSEDRHMVLPPFSAYRGNPVLMAMLEHVVRKIGEDTGGGSLYFRNRIRDVLAGDKVSVEQQKLSVSNNEIDATALQFRPFEKDQRLGPDSIYSRALFTISLSEKVPGGIIGVGVESEPDKAPQFSRQLTIVK